MAKAVPKVLRSNELVCIVKEINLFRLRNGLDTEGKDKSSRTSDSYKCYLVAANSEADTMSIASISGIDVEKHRFSLMISSSIPGFKWSQHASEASLLARLVC